MHNLTDITEPGGLVRPNVRVADAITIALDLYGVEVSATELGSNQDRNFMIVEADGTKSVLRIDNPVFGDEARDAQHAALDAYRAANVRVASVLPGLNGELTQRWNGFAVRRSEFAHGKSLVDHGYLAPVVLEEFGALAAASVNALADLEHHGLGRPNPWDMRGAFEETLRLAAAITDEDLREDVLEAAIAAHSALQPLIESLPVQAIHGDLTDDNVVAQPGDDRRYHPHTLLDLGDLGYGWRIAELSVTVSSMLHHEPARPLRALDTIVAFDRVAPIADAEARAVWPLVVLRAAHLVASGWRQLEIDGDNDYARERIAGEQAIFDSATHFTLAEMTEQVLAALGRDGIACGAGLRELAAPAASVADPLRALLSALTGEVAVIDAGVESEALEAGKFLAADADVTLVHEALGGGAAAVVLPYGVFRLTRTAINSADGAETWPLATEIVVAAGEELAVAAPVDGKVVVATDRGLLIELAGAEWYLSIDGVQATAEADAQVQAGDVVATLVAAADPRPIAVTLCRADAVGETAGNTQSEFGELVESVPPILALEVPETGRAQFVAPERVPAWDRFTVDPADILGLESFAQRDEAAAELERRQRIFASAQERYYERPMQIERGWRQHLIDTTGRSYVDMVNNVTGLGHGHPGVAAAASRQIRILNTNSRFLYRELTEYSERLLEMLPEDTGLDTVLLVNSGSEAVDLALRLAQAATGRKTIVSLREAYHGWTMASDAVTTSAYDNPYALDNRPDWVHVADVPNRFRGTYRGAVTDATIGAQYAADLGNDLTALAEAGRDVAGFICESVLGNAGGVLLPDGYLRDVYARVRAAGGVCIADEVQVGFGRMGSSFWGFEQSGVTPDIITIAKPMGNGFPIGGVITTKKIADALATQGQFFASAGGNPLSCRVGIAVLDAMRDEQLQENARVVGSRLAAGFRELAERHDIIGPIHGEGLYLGVELVRDRETLEPAKEETAAICERLKELGVIVLTTSERSNVLKVKPPLCLTEESADFMVAQLDRVLTEGW
ncbi:aminotransferase [Leucobacter sp. cx-328]|uniref:aminotransferase n=1 Tax=unclassified Leucobacter TaxID=2621730 RepID=UPI00165E204C|nr:MULTISPECIES: aminotransferase [unclassified Leucobacter]MBC9944118.1 aminotransferase [Leucobacter sp. cx-328]